MLRRVNLVVLLGLIAGAVFVFGLTAGAAPSTEAQGDEVGEAQKRLAELRMDAGAAYEAHGSAVFQLGELDAQIGKTNEDLAVTEEDLGEAQARLEDRASRMYKSGNVGFVDVLVGAENFSEFSNRVELWVRLLAQERAEFDRVREIRDNLSDKKALLEATRERRVEALEEADSQLDLASGLEEDAQTYLDGLNAELQADIEAEQARQVELARAEGERIRAEIAEAEPEAVQPIRQPVPQAVEVQDVPAEAIPAGVVTEVPVAPAEKTADAPEKTVEAEPVAATVPETVAEPAPEQRTTAAAPQAEPASEQRATAASQAEPAAVEAEPAPVEAESLVATVAEPVVEPVAQTQQVEEAPEVDLAAQRQANMQAVEATRIAAEQRAAEQAAAEGYAIEKAEAAEEARLAAEQATAAEEQYAADQQAAKAQRRAELAGQRAAAKEQAAQQAAAQQVETERLAAEQQQATVDGAAQQDTATEDQYKDAVADQGQYKDDAAGQIQYKDGAATEGTVAAPADAQYDGASPTTAAPAAAPAEQPAAAAPAPAASASGSAVIAEAANHMGTPYVFSPPGPCANGVGEDCSCHTMLVFQMFGISLPDDPVAQFGMGVAVSGPPQAGDLVFWAEGGAGITHVGIATGNGTTIHASTYKGLVTETPIEAIPGYVGARRVL